MPELPEVETTVRMLRPDLVGRTVIGVQLDWPRHSPDPDALAAELPGRRILDLDRRGKHIIIRLDPPDRTLLIHLGMSGRLAVAPPGTPPEKYAHTIFSLDDGQHFRFIDPRKFGHVELVADPVARLARLGPEPLSDELTVGWLSAQLAKRRRAIKPLLMVQSFVAGIGNIYADEILHRAGIDPRRPANSLDPDEVAFLHTLVRDVIAEAIEHQGTSFDWVYPDGGMQERLRVYGRKGEPCLACGHAIERIVLGQRGTHFCPICQR